MARALSLCLELNRRAPPGALLPRHLAPVPKMDPHLVQAQAQATLDCAQRHMDHAGDLRVGQAAEVDQHNNPLLVGRQALNHGAHLLVFQALACLLPGVSRLPRRQAVIKGYLAILAKGAPPPLVNGAVTQQPPAH